jgi:Protein of unknown function (DUF1579)
MKFAFALAFAAAATTAATPARADDKAAVHAQADHMKKMMEAMAKYTTPDEHHKRLELMAGSWTAAGRFWMGPGKPIETLGTAEKKLTLGGRFLVEDFAGNFMGQPFQGHGVTGYDLTKQRYTWFWVDNMGTWMILAEGTADAAGKVLTSTSQELDPATGKPRTMRYVTRIESDKKHTMEFFDTSTGKDVKMAEIIYTRR